MVRYRSDESDEDRDSSRRYKKKSKSKKRRGRSRSGSDSESSHMSSSRGKKAKKRYGRSSRSPSRERDQGRSSRRSRSSSYDRYHSSSRKSRRSRSRSPTSRKGRYSRSPYRSRSRSPSTRKGRRSSSRSKDQRRRSRSYSRERSSRSDNRSQSRRSSPDSRGDASADMKRMNLSDQAGQSVAPTILTPAQQAEERMRLALKAAAAADQKLRQLPHSGRDSPASGTTGATGADNSQPKFSSYEESQSFADSVAAIDSGNFSQATFKSSRSNAKPQETPTFDLMPSHEDAIFGSLAVTGFTLKPDPDTKPIELDPDSIMHPSLFCDPEEKLDRWIERLTQLRKRKLEGDAL